MALFLFVDFVWGCLAISVLMISAKKPEKSGFFTLRMRERFDIKK
jgi:hypothetical protein